MGEREARYPWSDKMKYGGGESTMITTKDQGGSLGSAHLNRVGGTRINRGKKTLYQEVR